jgi:hypothetical protein
LTSLYRAKLKIRNKNIKIYRKFLIKMNFLNLYKKLKMDRIAVESPWGFRRTGVETYKNVRIALGLPWSRLGVSDAQVWKLTKMLESPWGFGRTGVEDLTFSCCLFLDFTKKCFEVALNYKRKENS